MKKILNGYFLAMVTIVTACTSLPDEKLDQERFSKKDYEDEYRLIGKDDYQLGIALSGGGLRSSLFAYGVLKELYDSGTLENVDIISSVSGGGYTAYALFTSNDESNFGDGLFRSDNYLEETCRLITTGNFVTLRNMLGTIFSLNPKAKAVDLYHQSIGRTFGKYDQGHRLARVDDFLQPVTEGRKPFWVINTTVVNPDTSGWSDALFEFTPLWMGNGSHGYKYLEESGGFELRKAIAISGAAFAPMLKQDVPVSLPKYSGDKMTLSDGGHSENLGVVALVKRGVENLIVIDAEHDPNYSFKGYENLKKRLKAFDSILDIDEIDTVIKEGKRLKHGLYVGEITTTFKEGKETSKIFYLKMGMAESLDKVILNEKMNDQGRFFHDNYFETLENNKDADGVWNCSAVRDNNINFKAWYAYNISRYSGYLNYENYVRHADLLPGDFFTAKFPQYTTLDQSFYLDQALAFIGLGYWGAQEISENLEFQSLKKQLQSTIR